MVGQTETKNLTHPVGTRARMFLEELGAVRARLGVPLGIRDVNVTFSREDVQDAAVASGNNMAELANYKIIAERGNEGELTVNIMRIRQLGEFTGIGIPGESAPGRTTTSRRTK